MTLDVTPLRVLLVEDSPMEARLLVEALRQGGFEPTWERVLLLEELPRALERTWDVVLCDYALPGYTALDALELISTTAPDLPCIVVTGAVGEELAVACMRAGAKDLLLKDRLQRLAPAIHRELKQAHLRRQRQRARWELEITHRFLMIANRHTELQPLLDDWTQTVVQVARVEAVGIRLLTPDGRVDHQAQQGFPRRFLARENPLETDQQCICAAVFRGDTEALPLEHTDAGSCWTADFSGQLAGVPEPPERLRRGCIEQGFESLAWVPILIAREPVGVLQLADTRPGVVDGALVSLLELLAVQLGTAVGRIRALARLRQEERFYSTLVQLSPDAILVADAAWSITAANHRSAQVYGHDDPSSLVGLKLDQVICGELQGECTELRQSLLEAGERGAELDQRRRDGTTFPAELHASVILQDGQPRRTVVSVRDITERHEMQAQLAQADRLASVGMLAAGVAHEVNNPLTYVLQNLDWLIEGLGQRRQRVPGSSPDDLIEAAREARDGAERVRSIVRDLRTFSRVEGYSVSPVDLNKVLRLAASMAQGEVRFRAHLVQQLGQVPPVMANEGRLCQVFLNLLLNAAQAVDQGRPEEQQIELRSWTVEDEVHVSVRDTGEGILPEHIKQLFTPFFTTRHAGGSSGLGLAICHSLIVRFKGHMEVHSEVGQGTLVTVRLPAAPPDQQLPAAPQAAPAPQPSQTRGRVLLIDDEPCLLSSVARRLGQHEVVCAASGIEGQKILQRDRRFDAIICDLMMPRFTGIDLFLWLQEEAPELARRVVFTSGGPDRSSLEEFLEEVPNPRLYKPFEAPELLQIVDRLINEAP